MNRPRTARANYPAERDRPAERTNQAERADAVAVGSIMARVAISTDVHGSKVVAVVAHHDCAGNPADEATQRGQLTRALDFLSQRVPGVLVLGLWVDSERSVFEAERREPSAAA
ncbi:MAG: carbonic anhydrase [Candidatus Eisenbacteria bacterium]